MKNIIWIEPYAIDRKIGVENLRLMSVQVLGGNINRKPPT